MIITPQPTTSGTLDTSALSKAADEFSAGVEATRESSQRKQNQFAENPYRAGTGYAAIFDLLYKERERGITKWDLQEESVRVLQKDRRLVKYDVAIVISPTAEGESNRSAKANYYWVRRVGNRLFVEMRRRVL